MSKRYSSRALSRAIDPMDVLAGRLSLDASGLLELIRSVNPTGRDRGAREEAERYALKARLQSLLIRRHADSIEVAAEPGREGVVSLRHRGHGRDACHAVVAALDEDARSWVQRQLDLAEEPAPRHPGSASRLAAAVESPPLPAAEGSPEALLRRAEQALDEYDYEQARALLEEAFTLSKGAPDPAVGLLSLLVDILGDDAAAMGLKPSLSRAALAEPKARVLLALAASRAGEERQAEELVRGLDIPRAAEVHAALAKAALRAGRWEEGAVHAEHARRIDPACPDLPALTDAIAAARAAARAPLEAELLRAVEGGDDARLVRQARGLLARWPDSEVARRVLGAAEQRLRAEEARRLSLEAEEATARGDMAAAVTLLRRALAAAREVEPAAIERAAIERRIQEIEAEERARAAAARVEQAVKLLEESSGRAGLLAYLELDKELRERVRARRDLPLLRWLEQARSASDGARVEAALALVRARETTEPEEALRVLWPHEGALERVPEALELMEHARAVVRAREVARAREAIAAARAALGGGAPERALALLDGLVERALTAEEQAEAAFVRGRAAAVLARARLEASLVEHRAAGRLFEARDAADALEREASCPEERARSRGAREDVQREIQRAFCVEVDEAPGPEVLRAGISWASVDGVLRWLTLDGRTIILAEAHGRWAFFQWLDRATLVVRRSMMLRAPEPLGDITLEVRADTLFITGERGQVLLLSLDTGAVERFHGASERLPDGAVFEHAVAVAGAGSEPPRYVWVQARVDREAERVQVLDLERSRLVKEIADVWSVHLIPAADQPRVATVRNEQVALYSARGTPVEPRRLRFRAHVHEITIHPIGLGLLAMTAHDDFDNPSVAELSWVEVSPEGAVASPAVIEGAEGERPSVLAVALEERMAFITFMDAQGDQWLVALRADGGKLAQLYRVPFDQTAILVQDCEARRVVAVSLDGDGPRATVLGPHPPDVPARSRPAAPRIPGSLDLLDCRWPSGARNAGVLALVASLQGRSQAELGRWSRQIRQRAGVTPEELVEAVLALEHMPMTAYEESKRLFAWLWETHPTHPEVRLLRARDAASDSAWEEVRSLLAGVDPGALDEASAKHAWHLRALAALYTDHADEAEEALRAASEREGRCELDDLFDLVSRPEDPARGGALPGSVVSSRSPLGLLVDAVRAADAYLAAGDAAGAISALDRPVLWEAEEIQSLARLADAHLRRPPASPRDRFRATLALAAFCEANSVQSPKLRAELPIAGARWSREALSALSACAERRLSSAAPWEQVE